MVWSWVVFALLSALFAGLVAVFGKVGLHGIDTNTATAIRAVVMALFLVVVIFVQGKLFNVKLIFENHKALLFIILSGLAGAFSWLFYFVALKSASVSQVVPFDRMSVVFALFLAVIFLGETINWKIGLGAALIVIGGILVAFGK